MSKYVLKAVLLVNYAMETVDDDHVANSTITLSPRFVLRGRLPEYMIEHINKYELGGGDDCQVSLMIILQVLGADEYCFTIRLKCKCGSGNKINHQSTLPQHGPWRSMARRGAYKSAMETPSCTSLLLHVWKRSTIENTFLLPLVQLVS
jgi:hypothetical protein